MDRNVIRAAVGAGLELGQATAKFAEEVVAGLAKTSSSQPAWFKEQAVDGLLAGAKNADQIMFNTESLGRIAAAPWSKQDATRGLAAYMEGSAARIGIRNEEELRGVLGPQITSHDVNAALTVMRHAESPSSAEALMRTNPQLVDSISSLVNYGDFPTYNTARKALQVGSEVVSASKVPLYGGTNVVDAMLANAGGPKHITQIAEALVQDMRNTGFSVPHTMNWQVVKGAWGVFRDEPTQMHNAAVAARIAGTVDKESAQTVGRMLESGWKPLDITRADLQTAQVLKRYDAGFPTPDYIGNIQSHPRFTLTTPGELPRPVLDDVVIPKLQDYMRRSFQR